MNSLQILLYHDFIPSSKEMHLWHLDRGFKLNKKKHVLEIESFWNENHIAPDRIINHWLDDLNHHFKDAAFTLGYMEREPFIEDTFNTISQDDDNAHILILPLFPFTFSTHKYLTFFSKLLKNKPQTNELHFFSRLNDHLLHNFLEYRRTLMQIAEDENVPYIKIEKSITELSLNEDLINKTKKSFTSGQGNQIVIDNIVCPLGFTTWQYIHRQKIMTRFKDVSINPPLLNDPEYLLFLKNMIKKEIKEVEKESIRKE